MSTKMADDRHGRSRLESGERVLARHLKPGPRPSRAPAGRRENLLALVDELRHSKRLTCSDLTQRTGLAVPTVHRLLATLVESKLVIEDSTAKVTGGMGRPASPYRFNQSVASVAGVDVGGETTRVAIAAADGTIIASRSLSSAQVAEDLPAKIGPIVASLMRSISHEAGRLVGVGVGIPGSLDPVSGVVSRAFIHERLVGLPLKALLEERLSCPVVIEKDDHLSVVGEVSDRGTVPGGSSLVVVNYGRGIGVGVVSDGVVIRGVRGEAGRIMYWPSDVPRGVTIGEALPPDAMLAAYRADGGAHPAVDGASLCELARAGDPVAGKIVRRAAKGLAAVFLRLATMFDPEHMVLGGGFAGSFDLFDHAIREALSVLAHPPNVLPTAIGSDAVVVGGLHAADQFIESWLVAHVDTGVPVRDA